MKNSLKNLTLIVKEIVDNLPKSDEYNSVLISNVISESKKLSDLLHEIFNDYEDEKVITLDELEKIKKPLNKNTKKMIDEFIRIEEYAILDETELQNLEEEFLEEEEKEISEDNSQAMNTDSVAQYLREIGSISILSREEVSELCERIKQGDEQAKNELIYHNLKLVPRIAKSYLHQGLDFMDLIQEGNMGLMKCAEKFDPSKGFMFSTYATWWIMQTITRAIVDTGKSIRYPVYKVDEVKKVYAVRKKFKDENGRYPTNLEISQILNIKEEKVKSLLDLNKEIVSLDDPVGESEHGVQSTRSDFIEDSKYGVDELSKSGIIREKLLEVLNEIPAKEAQVLRLRFGIDDGIPRTLEEVSTYFYVTRERIRQIEAKGLRLLRKPMYKSRLEGLLDD